MRLRSVCILDATDLMMGDEVRQAMAGARGMGKPNKIVAKPRELG